MGKDSIHKMKAHEVRPIGKGNLRIMRTSPRCWLVGFPWVRGLTSGNRVARATLDDYRPILKITLVKEDGQVFYDVSWMGLERVRCRRSADAAKQACDLVLIADAAMRLGA